ncbi:TonB family protein [Xanthomonas maliensis]|uniref:TonB family protein n=1 Tax=Xanthomonas maliensis TaxID=1321368 RepID=UPI0003A154CC|nr:TonB family protein [Xanthomonas maliensis]KAB7767507.1 energy transducer TonB [Xanthomonas maliensis]
MRPDIVEGLLSGTLATSAAVVLCLLLRWPLRRWLGAGAAYAAWSCVPLALLVDLLPHPAPEPSVLQLPTVAVLPTVSAWVPPHPAWGTAVMAVWAGGAVLGAMLLYWQQRRFASALGPTRVRAGLHWAAREDLGLPAVLGVWRPRIVLPADFFRRYTPQERALILAHERVHLRRGDLQINLLATVLLCLGWCNPLVHLGWRAFRLDQEFACDAAVLARHPQARHRYATAMLKTQLGAQWLTVACGWTHPLVQRIAALQGPHSTASMARWSAPMVLLLAVLGASVGWAAQPARPQEQATVPAQDFARLQPPHYPKQALDAGVQGEVVLRIAMDARGVPQRIVVERSKPAGVFDQAVLDAARQWRLFPGTVDGRPVASVVRVPVRFELDADDAPHSAAPATTRVLASTSTQTRACSAPGCLAARETLP